MSGHALTQPDHPCGTHSVPHTVTLAAHPQMHHETSQKPGAAVVPSMRTCSSQEDMHVCGAHRRVLADSAQPSSCPPSLAPPG